MEPLVDLFVHLDRHLADFVAAYGVWVYALLFVIVFCETGLVLTPFLPGDSLLFATGALAASGALDAGVAALVLAAAAIAGDAVNYSLGRFAGPRVFRAEDRSNLWHRLLNRQHLDRAHAFFERYGGKAIVLGRFVPIVRTFVPFVAGAADMSYPRFAFYNVTGGIAWVLLCMGAGFGFGNVPFVKHNFSLVALGIVTVSLMPIAVEYLKSRRRASRTTVVPGA
jgi:membrane-associated protein